MEAGVLIRSLVPLSPPRRRIYPSSLSVWASIETGVGNRGLKSKRDWVANWVRKNDDIVRSLPIYVGGASLLAVLLNRTVSGIAPVADAGSSQSRADLLTLGLAVTNILNGLVWLSIRPKSISVVRPDGLECKGYLITSQIQSFLSYFGYAGISSSDEIEPPYVDVDKLMKGTIYSAILKSGSQSYLANLSLYPGKSELPFLPSKTQSVIVQPFGDKGIIIAGGNTVRGFTASDQAWITLIAEKLDSTLAKVMDKIPFAEKS